MNTTIYLVRHSEPFKIHRGIEEVEEDILFANIKAPLSINGEKLAEIKAKILKYKYVILKNYYLKYKIKTFQKGKN